MPYRNKDDKRKHDRDYIRQKRAGTTGKGITGTDSYGKTYTTYFKDGIEFVPADGMLPERPRFLTLSDGQVWDRSNLPKPDRIPYWTQREIATCNRAMEFKSEMSPQERLARVLMATRKEITGLEGKVNLREMIWYSGFTLEEISNKLR